MVARVAFGYGCAVGRSTRRPVLTNLWLEIRVGRTIMITKSEDNGIDRVYATMKYNYRMSQIAQMRTAIFNMLGRDNFLVEFNVV